MSLGDRLHTGLKFVLMSLGVSTPERTGPEKTGLGKKPGAKAVPKGEPGPGSGTSK